MSRLHDALDAAERGLATARSDAEAREIQVAGETKVNADNHCLVADSGRFEMKGYAPAVIVSGPNLVSINDFVGRSECVELANGQFRLRVSEPPLRGTKNEPNVRTVLTDAIRATDDEAATCEVGKDDCGEDGVLLTRGERVPLQIITVPADSKIGHDASKGSLDITFDAAQGARWLLEAISRKANDLEPAAQSKTILALDARHAGLLAGAAIRVEFEKQAAGTPIGGFRQIWVVGPTASVTKRLR